MEYNAFIQFYAKLTTVFCDRNYLSHFVPAGIISPNDVHDMSNLSDNDRAMRLLKNILAPLECGENQSFYKMLEIMQTYGNLHAKQLAGNITLSVRGINPVVQNQITMTIEGTFIHNRVRYNRAQKYSLSQVIFQPILVYDRPNLISFTTLIV